MFDGWSIPLMGQALRIERPAEPAVPTEAPRWLS
jgi:hypothetical protein